MRFKEKKEKNTDHGLILQCPKILWQEKRKKKNEKKKMKNEKWVRSRPTTVKSHSSMLHCHIFSFIICCMYVSVSSVGVWGLEPIRRRCYYKISKRQIFVLTFSGFHMHRQKLGIILRKNINYQKLSLTKKTFSYFLSGFILERFR